MRNYLKSFSIFFLGALLLPSVAIHAEGKSSKGKKSPAVERDDDTVDLKGDTDVKKPADPSETQPKKKYRLGDTGVGPTIFFGFPHPLNLGIEAKYASKFGFAVDYGSFSKSFNSSGFEMTAKITNLDVRGLWFPWKKSFFLGLILGQQHLSADGHKNYKFKYKEQEVEVLVSGTVRIVTSYLTPHLGWNWEYDSGFNIGFELGYQLALRASSSVDFETEDPLVNEVLTGTDKYEAFQDDAEAAGRAIGKMPCPYVTLLHLGWLF